MLRGKLLEEMLIVFSCAAGAVNDDVILAFLARYDFDLLKDPCYLNFCPLTLCLFRVDFAKLFSAVKHFSRATFQLLISLLCDSASACFGGCQRPTERRFSAHGETGIGEADSSGYCLCRTFQHESL